MLGRRTAENAEEESIGKRVVTRANAVEVKRPVVTIEKSKVRNTASESTVA